MSRSRDGANPRAPRPPPSERVWPATIVAVAAQRSPIDERATWALDLDARVRTTRGRRQVRRLRYGTSDGGALAEAFRVVLGREPVAGEEPTPEVWTGQRCGVVLDATWAADGRQSVRIAALRVAGAVTERPDLVPRRQGTRHAWVTVYRLAPETDGDVVDLARTWFARALRSQAGYCAMAVVRSEPATVIVLTVWEGHVEAMGRRGAAGRVAAGATGWLRRIGAAPRRTAGGRPAPVRHVGCAAGWRVEGPHRRSCGSWRIRRGR